MLAKLFSKKTDTNNNPPGSPSSPAGTTANFNSASGPLLLGITADPNTSITSITIPKYRVKGNFVEYVVECSRNTTTWHVFRRYQQFKSLDQSLKQRCPMGSPYHCELGVIPVLTGSHWTNVTNASPELVERRRRYLEIYLQQLTIQKNLFYASKTELYYFLHDGEVPVHYRSKVLRPLLGFAAEADDATNEFYEASEDNGTDDDTNGPDSAQLGSGEGGQQLVGNTNASLLQPSNVVSGAVPDYSSNSANRRAADAEPSTAREAEDDPKFHYRERCKTCNYETVITYDVSQWVNMGVCKKCKGYREFEKIEPSLPTDDETTPVYVPSPEDSNRQTTDCFVDPELQLDVASSDDEKNDEEDDDGLTEPLLCAECNREFSPMNLAHRCRLCCKRQFCNNCLKPASDGDGSSAPRAKTLGNPPRYCPRCRENLERRSTKPTTIRVASTSPPRGSVAATKSDSQPSSPQLAPSVVSPQPQIPHKVRHDVSVHDFVLVTTLGRGTFGKVMKVTFRGDGKTYAMKVLSKLVIHKRRMIDYIKEEKAIMATLPPHPFICTLHFAFQTEHHVYFVMDYLPGGELYTHIYPNRNLKEEDARFYAAELILALEHIHNHDIVHRDIKPENIVLDSEGHAKLTDFGLARANFSKGRRRSFVGSAEYLAPETIQGEVQTRALDWWSVGVMLFEMLNGAAPFHAATNNDVYQAVLHKRLDFSKPCFSPTARSLLQKMLEKDPRQRLADPTKIKAHPFFDGLDWNALMDRKVRPPFVPCFDGNDTKYFNRDFTCEWATIPRTGGGAGRNTLEHLTRRFSNFHPIEESAPATTKGLTSSNSTGGISGKLPELINPTSFIGVWRLVRVELRSEDGKISFPWGSEVCGLLVYGPTGVYTMQVCPLKRNKFKSTVAEKMTPNEMSEAFATYVASFGRYQVQPGTNFIVHTPNGALCPNFAGGKTKERRYFELHDNATKLALLSGTHKTDEGIRARTAVVWERIVEATVGEQNQLLTTPQGNKIAMSPRGQN